METHELGTTFPDSLSKDNIQARLQRWSQAGLLHHIALAAILLLAAALRFLNLNALGYANHYYTAAVASMLKSWHNFFFVAAEPGGSVSVDKPPLGLWLQAISAYFLGVNGFAVLLPQIIAGLLSVFLVYLLVRRSFGTAAGLLAALALSITPVVVAVDRNNTIDSTLILTLLLAAWAFLKATEKGQLRYLLLGAGLVGIGFNIKMLEAYLPLPAFYALYFLGSAERLWRKLANLALASILLVVVSLSWAVAVDLTPANQRPYVGSSGDNSVLSLAIGYNGVERLLGMHGGRGGNRPGNFSSRPPASGSRQPGMGGSSPQPGGDSNFQRRQFRGYGSVNPPGNGAVGAPWMQGGNSQFPPPNAPSTPGTPGSARPPLGGFGGGFGGAMDTGRAGILRLFTRPLSNEMSWLLPFGLFNLLFLMGASRLRWPLQPKHQAAVLWSGWLLTGGVFFSIAGFFHPYYLATIAAPLAALFGIGALELWRLRERRPRLAVLLLLGFCTATLAFQVFTVQSFVRSASWLPLAIGLFVAGALLLVMAAARKVYLGATAGYSCLLAAILLTPGI